MPGVPNKTRLQSTIKKFNPHLVYDCGSLQGSEWCGDVRAHRFLHRPLFQHAPGTVSARVLTCRLHSVLRCFAAHCGSTMLLSLAVYHGGSTMLLSSAVHRGGSITTVWHVVLLRMTSSPGIAPPTPLGIFFCTSCSETARCPSASSTSLQATTPLCSRHEKPRKTVSQPAVRALKMLPRKRTVSYSLV